jgi:hypothetical protein
MKFSSLWVGGPLPKLQQTCLASFVYYGHNISLYVYDLDMEVPKGVIKKDAREIFPESELFLVENSYSAFSDMFRYKMIQKTGNVWVDADTLCMSSDWDFPDNIFASLEVGSHGTFVVGGVLSLPKDSKIVNYLVKTSIKYDKRKMVWSEIGPRLVNRAFHLFKYMKYAYPPEVFCGIKIHEFKFFWDPKKLKYILSLEGKSKSISLYNQMATRAKLNKNNFPKGSPLDYFYNKFIVDKQ